MWFGITYLDESEQVIVSIWDEQRPLRVGGAVRSVGDIVCALRQAGATTTVRPRCDACGVDLQGVPPL